MKKVKYLLWIILAFFCTSVAFIQASQQLGAGYGGQFRGNTDLEQYELFFRQPLPYGTFLKDTIEVSSALEIGVLLLQEAHSDNLRTPKFSLQPQIFIRTSERVNFIVGFGAGYMPWDTEFTKHNLGGPFFLSSKLGMQLELAEHWGLEFVYYHQSNASLYEHNASLNMYQFGLVYFF